MKPKEIRFNPKIEIRKDPLERENIIDSIYKHFKPERQEIDDRYVKTYEMLRKFQNCYRDYMSEVGFYKIYMDSRKLRYKTESENERAAKVLYCTICDHIIPRIKQVYPDSDFESLCFNVRGHMVHYRLKVGDEVKYFMIATWYTLEGDK